MSVTLVGSRSAPERMKNVAIEIARKLAVSNVPMFSGGANGMDDSWELGYLKEHRKDLVNVILPTKGFNDRKVGFGYTLITDYDFELLKKADKLIQQVHPYYETLDGFPYWAHIRNCFQVLGHDLETPSSECFLYAPVNGDSVTGGTRTAFEICKMHNIPTYNMAVMNELMYLRERFDVRESSLDFLL